MGKHLPRLDIGRWIPGRTNYLLLGLQVFLTVQGASRGMDYVLPHPVGPLPASLSAIEAALPLFVWGIGFLLAAGLVLTGLFGGWLSLIITGHIMLGGLYGAFAYGMLDRASITSWWLAAGGALLLATGLWVGLQRWARREWLRFTVAMLATGVGGWVCAFGLGYDFRTGTGLLVAAGSHLGFAIGSEFVASRTPTETGR